MSRHAETLEKPGPEDADDRPVARPMAPTFETVAARRFGRRNVLRGLTGVAAAALSSFVPGWPIRAAAAASAFGFTEIRHGIDRTHHVAEGYDAAVLIRWGDPVLLDAPAFDPARQTAAAQRRQFGYNNDFIGFVPLPYGSTASDRGLLCVNHEYVSEEVMFPGFDKGRVTREIVDIEMAAHGGSVVEVARWGGKWGVVTDSRYNRRIDAGGTAMRLSGPAAGTDRLRTGGDPSGKRVFGTVNNCAGGMTPWGTWLMAEENFNGYFAGDPDGTPEATNHARYGIAGKPRYAWGRYHPRWNVEAEPNEPNRFGWIVEVDPLEPGSVPVKRTALGRFKHEGAECVVNGDGRLVVYSGDDQRFEYLYRFVSDGRVDPADRSANRDLLDSGTLSVARFTPDGTVTWLPLVHGTGPLTETNGFPGQADVLIETRRAADLLGATPMDRPEDVSPNPKTGRVYVMLTNNSRRKEDQRDAVNDRARNIWGQIVELMVPDGDHAAPVMKWDLLVKCGDPRKASETGARWHRDISADGWFACPDNSAVDHAGRLWVTTDQGSGWARASGTADGVWAVETEGAARGLARMFFRVPVGAEMCGPCFTPDDETLFVAVQHPATDGVKDFKGFERNSTYEDPATRWPDFDPSMPPRPSIVAITRRGGGKIGS